MNCPKPFKNPKRTYRFWYIRPTIGGRVKLYIDVQAWDELDARIGFDAKTKDTKYKRIEEVEIID